MTEIEQSKVIRQLKIKDYIYIATLLIGALLWWRDDVKEDAVTEAAMSELQKDVSEIKSTQDIKFNTYDTYWIQNTKNITRIVTVLELPAD